MGGYINDASMPAPHSHFYPYPTKGDSGNDAAQQDQRFHYNPYSADCVRVMHAEYEYNSYDAPAAAAPTHDFEPLPYGTLHLQLEGHVSFVPYPTEEFQAPPATQPKEKMSRVFLGQLPYQVTDMQLDWLCYTFGNGAVVHHPERITKHDANRGCKVPTGCIHGYCESDLANDMLNSMHKRILVDDTGVWVAETPEQQAVLTDYCHMMKVDRTRRFQNRPYDTVVAQFATSSYVPPKGRQAHTKQN